MNAALIRYTPEPDELCGLAAAECYQGKNLERSLDAALGGRHTGWHMTRWQAYEEWDEVMAC